MGDYVGTDASRLLNRIGALARSGLLACLFGVVVHGAEPSTVPTQLASPPPAAAPAPSFPARTTDLFNGKDLAGWEYIAGAPADITQVAAVKDGVISVAGKPNGYFTTVAAYAEYTLHVEWRWTITTPNPATNGGILINVVSGPVQQSLWPTSFQVQLKVQRAGDVLSMGEARFAESPTTAGTVASPSSTLARHADVSERPLGEWNRADITVSGAVIDVAINEVRQNRVTRCTPSSGRIGFQLEGHPFELRNVTVGPLPGAHSVR